MIFRWSNHVTRMENYGAEKYIKMELKALI